MLIELNIDVEDIGLSKATKALRLLGKSDEQICEMLGVNDLPPRHPKSKLIDRSFLPCLCPHCESPIVSGYCTFHEDRVRLEVSGKLIIRRHTGACVCCGKGVIFEVTSETITTGPVITCDEYTMGCSNGFSARGVHTTTPLFSQYDPETKLHHIRVGVEILGSVNFINLVDKGVSPFDPNYHDNFCEGVGQTLEMAMEKLKSDFEKLSKSLF